ncbi:MAG: CGLD27 family protein, partial [Cyanobacteriota bacterium]|nr:CGLD27 family protein [Cyanobacteriota bacterium]
ESGWYDGQTWPKPPEVLVRDRLIVQYQVSPILRRLGVTLGGIFALLTLAVGALALWAPDLSPGR